MNTNPMLKFDDEIDLRTIFLVVWKARIPILILMLVSALIAYAVTAWLLPKQYQASAYIVVGRPAVQYDSSGDLSIVPAVPDLKALPELLKTSAILEEVMSDERVASLLPNTTNNLSGRMDVTAVGTSQLRLDVTETDSRLAVMVTKVWVERAVKWINYNYGISAYAAAIDDQIVQAKQQYKKAQTDMETFLAQDQTPTLTSRLNAHTDIYSCLEKKINASNSFLERLDQLDSNLSKTDGILSLSDALILASIEQDVDTLEACGSQVTVLQSPSPALFTNVNFTEGMGVIIGLRRSLQQRIVDSRAQQQILKNEIQELLVQIDQLAYQRSEFDRQRTQAASIYQELTFQKTLIENVLQHSGEVAAVSANAVKSKSVSLSPVVSAAAAGAVGLFLGALGALGVDWWRKTGRSA